MTEKTTLNMSGGALNEHVKLLWDLGMMETLAISFYIKSGSFREDHEGWIEYTDKLMLRYASYNRSGIRFL